MSVQQWSRYGLYTTRTTPGLGIPFFDGSPNDGGNLPSALSKVELGQATFFTDYIDMARWGICRDHPAAHPLPTASDVTLHSNKASFTLIPASPGDSGRGIP